MPTKKADIYTLAYFGNLEAFLKKFNYEQINDKDENGAGLLHYAISGDQFDIAMFLIDTGIDVNMIDTNAHGQTALHFICVYNECTDNHLRIAKKLLEKGIDINIRDTYGNNAIWTATLHCKGRNYDMVKLLMQYNPDITTKNKSGRSPLDFAIQVKNEKLIDVLLKGSKNRS